MKMELTQYEKDEILSWMKRREEYAKQNTVEKIDINLGIDGRNVIMSTNEELLDPEGSVELQLDWWLQGRIDNFTGEHEFIVSFPITYLEDNGICATKHYHKCYTKGEINNVNIVNEIIEQAKKILNKKNLTTDDFSGARAYGDVVHLIDTNGKKYSELINIKVHIPNNMIVYDEINEKTPKVIDKKYFDLTKDDVDTVIDELDIDVTTPQGDTKRDIVSMFCKNYMNMDFFMHSGKSFSTLNAWVDIFNDKLSIEDIIDTLSIKPKYLDYVYSNSYILEFEPNERFYLKSWVDYLRLLISFVEYLESISIEGIRIRFDMSPFDNNEFIQVNNNLEERENIKFTKELFNYGGVIKD
ncbi:hypothetical protein [Terrisporobacter muris]|uniref:Uncharacterized protein n=1 Tax=Terrisporobacter muris TaxID=2963284 RepID=A0A9X2MAM4_9FIRM|nr:hypothetical protein [Terrisporobacter muris]MCR1823927.1 hypothetical protein [Terrisporobacter muris]